MALLVVTTTAASQIPRPVSIPDEPTCGRCAIAIQRLVTLGFPDDHPTVGPPISVAEDGQGRIWVVPMEQPPLVFERSGRFLRAAGPAGSGPGEFSWVSFIVPLPGDSMLVLDQSGQRGTILGPGLSLARTLRLGWAHDYHDAIVLQWPSSMVFTGTARGPAVASSPLHVVELGHTEARLVRSFGPEQAATRPDQRLMHRLAISTNGRFWSAERSTYLLHFWADTVARRFERRPPWFAAGTRIIGTPSTPPSASITAIQQDSSGLLWVFTQVPAPTWRQAWSNIRPGAEVPVGQIGYEFLFRTMVEIIDPRSARVVVARQLDEWVTHVLPGQKAATYTVDREGAPHVVIVQLRVSGR